MTAQHPNERFRGLSEARRRLLRQMQDIRFGKITFRIHNGEPDLSTSWRICRTIKLAGQRGPQPEADLADFELCKEHNALIKALSVAADGECATVEVRHGLPCVVEIEQDRQAA